MSKVNSVKALRAKRSKRLAQKRGLPQLKVVPITGLLGLQMVTRQKRTFNLLSSKLFRIFFYNFLKFL